MTLLLVAILAVLFCAYCVALSVTAYRTTKKAFATGRPVKKVSVSPTFRRHVEFYDGGQIYIRIDGKNVAAAIRKLKEDGWPKLPPTAL